MSDDHLSPAMEEDLENQLSSSHRRPSFRTLLTAVGYPILQKLSVFLLLTLIFLLILVQQFVVISKYEDVKSKSNVESAVISSFNVSATLSELKGGWNVTLSLNEDVTSFKYEGRAWLYDKDEFLITTTTSTYYDSKGHHAFEHGRFTMDKGIFTSNGEEDFGRDGDLRFDLLLQGNVTYSGRLCSERTLFLTVECIDLKIEFVNNVGTLLGGPKNCRVGTYLSKLDALYHDRAHN